MSRITRGRAKGRRGGGQRFAYVPLDLLESEAGKTLPHAAMRVLLALVAGQPRERNGTLACSQSYGARFGLANDTTWRCLKELESRGIITITRRVQKLRRFPTLWAVTWWPCFYLDGQPCTPPTEPTFAYLKWTAPVVSSTRPSSQINPMVKLNEHIHQPVLPHSKAIHQPDGQVNSRSWGGASGLAGKVRKLINQFEHLTNRDISNSTGADEMEVARIREQVESERRAAR